MSLHELQGFKNHPVLSSRRMPSPRVIIKLATALIVAMAIIGQLQNRALASHFTRPDAIGTIKSGRAVGHPSTGIQTVSKKPSKKDPSTVKRHKRLLITKFFRPEPAICIFIKRYCGDKSFPGYSSPHVLRRAVAYYGLRGPPLC